MVTTLIRRSIAVAVLVLVSCSPAIGRTAWSRMHAREKTIYVRSLIGHERVTARKGGNRLRYDLPPAEYVRRIDAAYRHGDRRRPAVIFEEMGTP
ncbi:MAG TPA: hypothetical protein VKH35_14025 [Thermoanaerobaculia bacterium]|nr:hypothetical protein [Thermoanaerobaculia bacterium]